MLRLTLDEVSEKLPNTEDHLIGRNLSVFLDARMAETRQELEDFFLPWTEGHQGANEFFWRSVEMFEFMIEHLRKSLSPYLDKPMTDRQIQQVDKILETFVTTNANLANEAFHEKGQELSAMENPTAHMEEEDYLQPFQSFIAALDTPELTQEERSKHVRDCCDKILSNLVLPEDQILAFASEHGKLSLSDLGFDVLDSKKPKR